MWLKSTSNLCSLFTRLANRCTFFIVRQGLCTIYKETVIHLSGMLGATFINCRVWRGMYTIPAVHSRPYIKLAKGCLILWLVIVRRGSHTILGKNNPTLIRLAKACLCIFTHICRKICSTLTLLVKHAFTFSRIVIQYTFNSRKKQLYDLMMNLICMNWRRIQSNVRLIIIKHTYHYSTFYKIKYWCFHDR